MARETRSVSHRPGPGQRSYLDLAESLGSVRQPCELMGLVEGVEWFLPPANAPPPEGLMAA